MNDERATALEKKVEELTRVLEHFVESFEWSLAHGPYTSMSWSVYQQQKLKGKEAKQQAPP